MLGELILSVTQVARPGTFGLSAEFGRAALGVLIAACFAASVFDQAISRAFVHAARRHFGALAASPRRG